MSSPIQLRSRPLSLVPQIYCSGSKPSRFKIHIAKCAQYFSIAGVVFGAYYSAICIGSKLLPGMSRIIVAVSLLLGVSCFMPVFWLAQLAQRIANYYAKRYLNYSKPTDEKYQAYLLSLVANKEMKDIIQLVHDTHFNSMGELDTLGLNLQAATNTAIDTLLKIVADKYSLDPLTPSSLKLLFYARIETQDSLLIQFAEKMKGKDAFTTSVYIRMRGVRGIKKKKIAHMFKTFAESELSLARQERSPHVRENLAQIGLGVGEIPQVIIRYYSSEIHERIERIYVYTFQTKYKIGNIENLNIYHSLLCEIARFYIDHPDYRDFDEAIDILSCLPNRLKRELINSYPSEAAILRHPELTNIQEKIEKATEEDEETLTKMTTTKLSHRLSQIKEQLSIVFKKLEEQAIYLYARSLE